MLNSLSIQNFQSHKKTELEFSPGINVITGVSDSGKTAIIRALRWLVYNRPTGEAFRSSWGGETLVELQLNNLRIRRVKNKTINSYWLNDMEFKAFGSDVPEEIRQVLNLNEINIQQQLDRPFLLDDSPGEVAGYFNRIAHLDVIDRGLQKVQKWLRELDLDINTREQHQIELQDDLKTYEYIDNMETEVEVLEQMESHKISIGQGIQKIKSLLQSIEEIKEQTKLASRLLPAEKQVDRILTLFKQKTNLEERKQALLFIFAKLSSIGQALEENQGIIQCEKYVDQILSLYNQQKEQIQKTEGLSSLIDSISITKKQAKEKELQILEMQQDFDHYMPDICPLCEAPKEWYNQ